MLFWRAILRISGVHHYVTFNPTQDDAGGILEHIKRSSLKGRPYAEIIKIKSVYQRLETVFTTL